MSQKAEGAGEAKWDRTQPPDCEAIVQLPRWAWVAFASRCARRVQPLFKQSWPSAPQSVLEAIDRAITLAESSSRVGGTPADFVVVNAAAINAAKAGAVASVVAPAPANALALAVARAAARAVRAADHDRIDDAAGAAAYAADCADAARANVIAAMWADLDLLGALARRESWKDGTPVDPDLCGPLWPNGAPEG